MNTVEELARLVANIEDQLNWWEHLEIAIDRDPDTVEQVLVIIEANTPNAVA